MIDTDGSIIINFIINIGRIASITDSSGKSQIRILTIIYYTVDRAYSNTEPDNVEINSGTFTEIQIRLDNNQLS